MGNVIQSIQFNRVLVAIAITFLIADTYPHPNLGPGLVELGIHHLQQRFTTH